MWYGIVHNVHHTHTCCPLIGSYPGTRLAPPHSGLYELLRAPACVWEYHSSVPYPPIRMISPWMMLLCQIRPCWVSPVPVSTCLRLSHRLPIRGINSLLWLWLLLLFGGDLLLVRAGRSHTGGGPRGKTLAELTSSQLTPVFIDINTQWKQLTIVTVACDTWQDPFHSGSTLNQAGERKKCKVGRGNASSSHRV